jgi:GT2 family glycosyltransferase
MRDVVLCVVNWSTPDELITLLQTAEEIEGRVRWSIYQNHHDKLVEENRAAIESIHRMFPDEVVSQVGATNAGHGAGINRAANAARMMWDPKYLFLLNPDCWFKEPVIDVLIDALEEDPKRFSAGPRQADSRNKLTAAGIVGTLERPEHRWFQRPDDGRGRDRVSCPMIAGSAMMVDADMFFRLGGMMEGFHYYSDTWLCFHAIAHGRENWYIGDVLLMHEWHTSSPRGYPGSDGKFAEDRETFRTHCKEHDPPIPYH